MPRTFVLLPIFLLLLLVSPVCAEVQIALTGLPKELQLQVLEAIALPPALKNPGPLNPLWLERYQKQLPQKVHDILEPFGYFHAEVSSRQEPEGDKVLLRVHVDPGPAVRLVERRIELVPSTAERPDLALKDFPLKTGDVLREDLYETGKAELLAHVQDQGFLDARFTRHEVQIDRELNQARIFLQIASGERSRFGAVKFSGADEFPERFLRRYLAFKPGDEFSYRLLGRTQKNLRDSDRFRRVLVIPLPEERQGVKLPIEIELEPRKRYSLRPGIGYGTDTGARLALRYRDANVWKLGHTFNLDLLAAQKSQSYTGSYAFPGYRNLNTGLNLQGGYRAEQLDNYNNSYIFSEAEQTYGFGGSRIGAVFVRAQYEKSDISADSVYTGFLMPGLRYTEVQLPETTGKGYGYHLKGEVRGSDQRFFSEISLMQLLGSADLFVPLPFRTSVTLRGQVATTLTDHPFEEIPASLRFFAGGDRSVRGYAYQALGPKDETGAVIGGEHLLAGSIELGKQLGQHWGVALFIDTGNAFNSWDDYVLKSGAGAGLRYGTPVGPIQVDLATPIGGEKFSLRLHIGIGFGW
ncbi:autotransporter assembly complex protein TamA [Geopsychrobacter electrodiphilus]|uniref:autotransporter assembly complex protein TamA n=1 Tax=Geopsychrobacter electrodiphilus TaxID=225196 RepID=UPI00035CFCE7|nr:autotransporter assembly complex family protein [Geopsychrobacter electrodiphilus]